MRHVICIMLLVLLMALNVTESTAFFVKTSIIRPNNTKTENGSGQTIIDVSKISLQEFCVFANISDKECTCEIFPIFCPDARIFTCARYWERVEGIVQVTVSAIGVFGNTLVVLIALRTWKISGKFNKLVALLGLDDLIFAVAKVISRTPLFWTCRCEYKTFLCKFLKASINAAAIFALWMITIIALEKYLAIVKPFSRSRLKFEFSFSLWALLATFFSIASVIPFLFVYKVSEDGICVEHWTERSKGSLIYSWYLLIGTFMIPMGIISYFYYCVITKVRENKSSCAKNYQQLNNTSPTKANKQKGNVYLAGKYNCVFCIGFPKSHHMGGAKYYRHQKHAFQYLSPMKYVALFPYLLHVSVNPLICSFIDKRFQREVLGLLRVKRKSSSTEINEQIMRGTIVNC